MRPKKSSVNMIITPDIAITTHHLRFAAVTDGLMTRGRYPFGSPSTLGGS